MTVPIVSDHAVLRYLERVKGFDLEAVRAHIAGLCKGIKIARCVRAEGHEFIMHDGVVVTVKFHGSQTPRRVPRDANKRREAASV